MDRFTTNIRIPLYVLNGVAFFTALLVTLVFYLPNFGDFNLELLIASTLAVVSIISITLTRKGHVRAAAMVFVTLLIGGAAAVGYGFHGLANPTVLILLFITLPFASLYFDRRGNVVLTVAISIVITGLYLGAINGLGTMDLIDPDDFIIVLIAIASTSAILDFTLSRLRTALALSEEAQASLGQQNEALNQVRAELEQRVEDRTRALENRAAQLEAVAEVAREAVSIRDLQSLLDQITHLISDRFGYYHCGLFLIDDTGDYAILQAASSEGGQRMIARGHRLQVGKVGVVGFAAGMGQPRIAQDVDSDVIYYNNPDMPETHSELALPLKVRQQVIGVLDVQSSQRNAFNNDDLQVLQLLADQVAVAIDNARLLESSRRALDELQVVYGQQVAQAWRRRLETDAPEFYFDRLGVAQARSGVALPSADAERFLAQPILFRNQPIGILELTRDPEEAPFTSEERSLVNDIIEQTALALENARLVDQIRLRSDQIQLLQEITSLAASLLSEKELLNAVVDKLQAGLDLLHAGVVLFNEDRTQGILTATASRPDAPGRDNLGAVLPLEGNLPTEEVIRSQRAVVLYDVLNHPSTAAFRAVMEPRGTHTLVIIPLITRGEVIGTIGLDVAEASRRFDDEDLNLFNQVSAQVAQALDSARLFQAEQRGRQAAAALLEITQIAASSLEMRHVLQDVTTRSAQAIAAWRCSVLLLDPRTNSLETVTGQFADGHIDETFYQAFRQLDGESLANLPFFAQVTEQRRPRLLEKDAAVGLPANWQQVFRHTPLLAVPLISQNQVIGFMVYDHADSTQTFPASQIDLAQTIAGQVATTISNANLYRETVRRAERERLVSEITTKVRASNDPRIILQTAIRELRTVLGTGEENIFLRSTAEKVNGKPTNGQNASGHTIKGRAHQEED